MVAVVGWGGSDETRGGGVKGNQTQKIAMAAALRCSSNFFYVWLVCVEVKSALGE